MDSKERREVRKGVWRMPRLLEAKKDVISCEKLRGVAHTHYIRRCPNGATRLFEEQSPSNRSKPAELKHLSKQRKRKQVSDFLSSGERKGNSPNLYCYGSTGVEGPLFNILLSTRTMWENRPKKVRVLYWQEV